LRFWCSASFTEPTNMLEIARACDDAGYHGVMVADHLAFPANLDSQYPYSKDGTPRWEAAMPWPDPWVAIGAMAAVTERVHFSTNIYIAPARSALIVAKQVATAACFAPGRVSLGAAVGWMREEYTAAGQDFSTRGRRLDEMLPVLRALWRGEVVEHHGEFFEIDGITISPVPPEPIPIFIGGDSPAALRRAASSDGWIGGLYDLDGTVDHVRRVLGMRDELGFSRDGYEVFVPLPGRRAELDVYRRLEDAGVTSVMCSPWMSGWGAEAETDFRGRIEAFAENVVARV
jgi:probable F420-dependent oxidoreductase